MKNQIICLVVLCCTLLFASSNAATFKQPNNQPLTLSKKDGIFRCLIDCLWDKIDMYEALRIIGKCANEDEPLPCFAQELGEHLYQCVSQCYQGTEHSALHALKTADEDKCEEKVNKVREHFKGLDRDGKKEFVKKVYKKLTEKYPDVERRKVGAFIGALLFARGGRQVPAKRVCEMFKRIFKSGSGAQVNAKEQHIIQDAGKCVEKVNKAREHFKGLDKEGKKEFVKKVYKALTEKFPDVPRRKVGRFIKVLLFAHRGRQAPAKVVCRLFKRIFKSSDDKKVVAKDADKCVEKVKKARKHFRGLEREDKKEFVKKVYKKLTEKFPDVERKKVGFFIKTLLFTRRRPQVVCKLFKKIFKSESTNVKKAPINKDLGEQLRCTVGCLWDKMEVSEILRIVGKCMNVEEPLPCFAQELGEHLFECVSQCFSKKKKLFTTSNNNGKCVARVERVRKHYSTLDKEGKKEFYKKVVAKLTEKHPEVCKKKVGFFTASLLFNRVPAKVPCKLYKKFFKSSSMNEVSLKTGPPRIFCVTRCFRDHHSLGEYARVTMECRQDPECWEKKMNSNAQACVAEKCDKPE